MKKIVFLLVAICLFSFPRQTSASENQFVTIVNPIRIAPYTNNSAESISAEYEVIRKNDLPATWLATFDVLENKEAVDVLQKMDKNQELGVFMEVTPKLCENSGVTCNEGSWHHANVIFLSGYTQEERKKLIDILFEKFHETFGYYPKSVGSWWTDSYSLTYMQEKYGITANLTCSDQYSTDGYQIWGQYWMQPFMPSKYHAGIPAVTPESQLPLVTIQWASRDPVNGYQSSLYSTQDYQTSPLSFDTSYFENLIKTYGFKNHNSFGQITVGLEGDYNPKDYRGEYTNQIHAVKRLIDDGVLIPVTMSEFSTWYRNEFSKTPDSFIESDDFLESPKKSFWYSSNRYRICIIYDKETQKTQVIDFRGYYNDLAEPYFISPNTQHTLSIYIPSYLDQTNNKEDIWGIFMGSLQDILSDAEKIELIFESGKIVFEPQRFVVEQQDVVVPEQIRNAKTLEVFKAQNRVEIQPREKWLTPQEGGHISALSEIAVHELARKRTKGTGVVVSSLCLVGLFLLIRSRISLRNKILIFISGFSLFLLLSYMWYTKNLVTYSISQSEIDVLNHLSFMSSGSVLVYDHECLGCEWSTQYKPAAYANQRGYVKKYGRHPIVYNATVFKAKTIDELKSEFQKLDTSYIYLVKYESMVEKLPFSPGDVNIEKVYSNANAELWRVKE